MEQPFSPELEIIVRGSIKRFEEFAGPIMLPMAKSMGWITEFEKEIRRVIIEARSLR